MDTDSIAAFWDPIIEAGHETAMIHAGLELQIWAKIAAGFRTAHDLAVHENWDPTGTRALLDALFANGLLDKDEVGYQLAPIAEQTLLPGSPAYEGNGVLLEWVGLGHSPLAQAIRTGKRPVISDLTSEGEAALWASFASTHGFRTPNLVVPEWFWSLVDSFWRAAGIEARDGLRALDVGCGPGVITMALARQNPGVRVTLLDRQPELDLARRVAEKLNLSRQLTMLAGDMRALDYGRNQFDVVLFSYCLMFFSLEEHVSLLRKAYDALVPGGTLVVSQYIADDTRRKRKDALRNALWIYAFTAQGEVYTTSECKGLVERAGFVNVTEKEFTVDKHERFFILGTKP